MFLVFLGGLVAYHKLGRLEDPEFTIKEALIITPYPGASAEEVAREVTNPIETACQQLGQLKRVESESTRGRSVVSAVIQDRFQKATIPQVWDELRRKIDDVQSRLAALGSRQVDRGGRFRRRLRRFPGDYGQRVLAARAAALRGVPAPRAAVGARRQESGSVQRATGSCFPGDFAATAGAVGHQRGTDLWPATGEERVPIGGRLRVMETRHIAHRPDGRFRPPRTCSGW